MKRGAGVGLVVIAAAAVLLALLSASARAGSGSPGGTLARNRAAARADAKAMLSQITLPSGATRIAGPSGPPPAITATTAGVRDEVRWRVPGETFGQAIAEVESRRPADVMSTYTESSGDRSGITSMSVGYILRNVAPAEIDYRVIQVTSAPAPGGSTVSVETESVWVVPRTAASMIPSATRLITLSMTTPNGHRLRSATLTGAARARAAVHFFNGLGADQPFTINCPAEFLDDTITVTFFAAAGAGARPLARASYDDDSDGQAGECDAVGLTVAGRQQDALLSPTYVSSLERLFAISLPRGISHVRGPAGS